MRGRLPLTSARNLCRHLSGQAHWQEHCFDLKDLQLPVECEVFFAPGVLQL